MPHSKDILKNWLKIHTHSSATTVNCCLIPKYNVILAMFLQLDKMLAM